MSRQTERYEARKAAKAAEPKGPSGIRPKQFLPPGVFGENPILATRANRNRARHLAMASFRRATRRVEYVMDKDFPTIRAKDKDGHDIPKRVLHETKGWQSARVAH